jgi:transglutaminase-like putative cysteine protease
VLATDLKVEPGAADVRLVHDAYSNSIALVHPHSPADHLRFTCLFTVEHTGERAMDLPLAPGAETYPFAYSAEDRLVLHPFLLPFYEPDDGVAAWARGFLRRDGPTDTRQLLVDMTAHIRETMRYQVREEEGVQAPAETLSRQCGSCRDYATLMIEAVRRLGYAARFVSGYVYAPPRGHEDGTPGATHAWLQVYLPGAGWITFDPTNNLVGGTSLIRVAYARDARFASPVSGTWTGAPADYRGMTVHVSVIKRP